MAIAYIFHFPIVRVDFGRVSGDIRDSGPGISVFRFMQVPSKVPNGLMQVDLVVCFRDWGLFWAISSRSFVGLGRAFWGLVLCGDAGFPGPPRGLEKNS